MRPLHPLTCRIRGEYIEMPGLRLTPRQACRLWQLDAPTCDGILGDLLQEGFLTRTRDGAFVKTDAGESRPAPDVNARFESV
jgi:hypothetical protein